MRIISGQFKGRRIQAPQNLPVRPTTDFAREALFNILNHLIDFQQVNVVDLFSGTGAISLELASRGCPHIVAVDAHFGCVQFLKKMADELEIKSISAIKKDVFSFLKSEISKEMDLVFADPPYDLPTLEKIPDAVFSTAILKESGFLILEHSQKNNFEHHPFFLEHRKYGNVNFSLFQKQ